jgi:flotillin
MAKKQSEIERESRVTVANNMQTAQVAEIEAKQLVEVRARAAEELVGVRAAERDREIGIRNQQSQQAIQIENAITAEKEMNVKKINTVRLAEITRESTVIAADQARQIAIKNAEGEQQQLIIIADGKKQQLTLIADGDLYQAQKAAEATRVKGEAEGKAQTAILMAPVDTQIELAKEIGANENYQHYLISLKQIEAGQVVGVESAKALSRADIKVVSTAGAPMAGMKSVMELVTPAGAAQLGAALESLSNMPAVEKLLSRINGKAESKQT